MVRLSEGPAGQARAGATVFQGHKGFGESGQLSLVELAARLLSVAAPNRLQPWDTEGAGQRVATQVAHPPSTVNSAPLQ